MRPPRVRLHIEEVVLRGFAHRDRQAIQVALHEALASHLEEREVGGYGFESLHRPSLDGGSIQLSPGAPPEMVGRALADAVLRGLGVVAPGERSGTSMERSENP